MPFLENQSNIDRYLSTEVLPKWRTVNENFGRKTDETLTLVIWPWPRETITKSGNPRVKGLIRKIDDTLELKNSRVLISFDNGFTWHHIWRAQHAATVAVGGTNSNGTFIPGRNWVIETAHRVMRNGVETLA